MKCDSDRAREGFGGLRLSRTRAGPALNAIEDSIEAVGFCVCVAAPMCPSGERGEMEREVSKSPVSTDEKCNGLALARCTLALGCAHEVEGATSAAD